MNGGGRDEPSKWPNVWLLRSFAYNGDKPRAVHDVTRAV